MFPERHLRIFLDVDNLKDISVVRREIERLGFVPG